MVNNKNQKQSNFAIFELLKWFLVLGLVSVAVWGNAYYSEQALLYRVLGVLALVLVACGIALTTVKGAAFWALAKDSRSEVRKVVWPTHQETTQTTLIVTVVVIVMALVLWGLDTLFGWLASLIIG